MLSHEEVQEILRLLDATEYQQLNLETDDFKLSLQRSAGGWSMEQESLRTPTIIDSEAKAAAAPKTAISSETKTVGDSSEALHVVTTPLPGVFYRAPQPGADPFVEVGSNVQPDTQVCIMESMKLMNAIYAGVNGTVREICISNGEVVEKDSVLIRIELESPDAT